MVNAATSNVAKECEKSEPAQQRGTTATTHTLLTTKDFDAAIHRIGAAKDFNPFLVAVPDSRLVRAIYGIGPGEQTLECNGLEDNVIALSGDWDDGIHPQPLKFTEAPFVPSAAQLPTDDEYENKVTNNLPGDLTKKLFQGSALKEAHHTFDILRAVPIPAYLIYDAFDVDIPAETIYTRVMASEHKDEAPFLEIRRFLKATSTKQKAGTADVAETQAFLANSTTTLRKWGRDRLREMLPNQAPPVMVLQNGAPAPGAAQGIAGQGVGAAVGVQAGAQDQQNTILATALQLLQSHSARMEHLEKSIREEKKDEANTDAKKFGLSKSDVKMMLGLCGLQAQATEDLPEYLTQMAEANISTESKARVVRALLQDKHSLLYPEAKIPMLPGTISMIVKKAWSGDSGAASADSATKGLTIFTMGKVSATTIVKAVEFEDALREATSTTPSEVAKSKKLHPHVPCSYLGLLQTIRTFCNLLHKLFTPTCPLLRELKKLIIYMVEYDDHEQCIFNAHYNTVILWIVFKQTRSFTEGHLQKPETALPEWITLLNTVSAKLPVQHVGVPHELFPQLPPARMQTDDRLPPDDKKRKAKQDGTKEDRANPATHKAAINQKIKSTITPLFREDPKLSISKLARAARTTIRQLTKDRDFCLHLAFKGQCDYVGCDKVHQPLDNDMADHVIDLCQPVIANPTLLDKCK